MPEHRRAITVRLPETVYRSASEMARRNRLSLNRLIQRSVEAAVKEEEQRRLREAFTLVGRDMQESDVEFAHAAQAEVVTGEQD